MWQDLKFVSTSGADNENPEMENMHMWKLRTVKLSMGFYNWTM